ncbi:PrgH/EprH family type III secretion apparatus protein [Symbiopectobacterium purcellii]|uniref:PrgH/EprH family type III secretion apparatus protein n=1 Tax=Symbiopectobacterium purcellii TaxID=2871826 RepID=A0ABX9AIC4_9ENTR|nr:PrgH/EprH family type III secretion apparatus protein [Symbiopectobacterium purcellii]QZN94797.1 PrgH/EprH family type III secretion apparatus protein [Symbiopectobacterium purcellii]
MLLDEDRNIDKEKRIVVRLLNGVLRGCEFALLEGNTLFLSTDEKTISKQYNGTQMPDNTIYIPAEQTDVSFEIIVKLSDSCHVYMREISDDGSPMTALSENEVITVGMQKFAWRNQYSEFSDDILSGEYPDSAKAQASATAEVVKNTKSVWYASLAAVALLSAVFAAGYGYLTGTQRQLDNVSTLLNFASDDYQIVYARDNWIYVFAGSEKASDWAIQTMVRNPLRQQVIVVNIASEEERISRWVETYWPALKFYQVRLSDPQHPMLRISKERNELSEKVRGDFIAALKEKFPYMDSVRFDNLEDKTIRSIANQGLKKMALSFREIDNGDTVTFVILGVIEDGMLESIKNFVNQYYQQWGVRYVHFSVELETDWFKDKSFKFGEQSYIKLGAGHWYFPKT